MNCRLCDTPTRRFLSLGSCPSPNRLLSEDQLGQEEPTYPMDLTFCQSCLVVQSEAIIPPKEIFTDYPYASSTSAATQVHFEGLAEALGGILAPGSLVVEIASNDGVLQRPLRERGVRCVGVEPARNICELAWRDGLETLNEFFTEETVDKLGPGSADVVVACNVFAHVPELRGFTRAIHRLLKDSGQLILEVEYLGDIIDQVAYGNFYQDHLFYWSLSALRHFLACEGLYVHTAERVPTQGGSIRVHASKREMGLGDGYSLLSNEASWGPQTYRAFASKVEEAQRQLLGLLGEVRAAGATIAAYGAAAKGISMFSYTGISNELIVFIIDDSPLKQGRFTPKTHIPIVPPNVLDEEKVDYLLLTAWNYEKDLRAKTEKYSRMGMRYILPCPYPRIA